MNCLTPLEQAEAALRAEDFTTADTLFTRLLRQNPASLPALLGKAHTEWAYGNLIPALGYTNRAHQADPVNLTVYELYTALLPALNYYPQAIQWAEQGLAHHPSAPLLLRNLALAHYVQASYPAALAAFRRLHALQPSDPTVSHLIASLSGSNPPAASADFIRQHFDGYLDFDGKLTGSLGYRVPEQLISLLQPHLPDTSTPLEVLDLGCGTGLCGAALRNHYPNAVLTGVDLVAGMLPQAAARGYTQLHTAELIDYLNSAMPGSADLILAGDVFIYLGDLAATVAVAARTLRPGGLFACSTEALPDTATTDYFLQPSSRYAHRPAYLTHLAATHGFTPLAAQDTILRHDGPHPIPGHLHLFRRISTSL